MLGLFVAASASAQTIHQYPYDSTVTAYSGPAAYPLISAQCHWRPGNSLPDSTLTPQIQSPSIAHTHMEVFAPIYGEFRQNFTVAFQVMLFHADGVISTGQVNGVSGELLSNVVWDNPPADGLIHGDPAGLVMATGHITVDFSKANGSGAQRFDIPKHGWFTVAFDAHTYFTNGDQTHATLYVPFFSMLDPTVPEQFFQQNPGSLGATCGAGSARDNPADAIGEWQVAQYNAYVPILAPITAPIAAATPGLYGYATGPLPNGTGMTRFDMDLHHGNAGTPIRDASAPATQGVVLPSPFDPAILGPGTHKVAALWQQDTGLGVPGQISPQEQATGLLVLPVTVGGTPPPPTWMTLTGIFQQQVQPDPTKFRLCPDTTGTNCQAFIKP